MNSLDKLHSRKRSKVATSGDIPNSPTSLPRMKRANIISTSEESEVNETVVASSQGCDASEDQDRKSSQVLILKQHCLTGNLLQIIKSVHLKRNSRVDESG